MLTEKYRDGAVKGRNRGAARGMASLGAFKVIILFFSLALLMLYLFDNLFGFFFSVLWTMA